MTSTGWQQRAITHSEAVRRTEARTIEVAQGIIDDARELMYDGGQSFTITQLVEHAGIAGQTFYRYFPGKEELLLATYEDVVLRSIAAIATAARAQPDPVARLRLLVERAVHAATAQPRARIVASEHARLAKTHPTVIARVAAPYRQLLVESIEEGRAAGDLRSLDPQQDARFISDAMFVTFQNLALDVTTEPIDTVLAHAQAFVLAALRAERG